MFSSDSDDRPLALHRKREDKPQSRSASPLPDWLSQASTPAKALEILDDSDADTENSEDLLEDVGPSAKAAEASQGCKAQENGDAENGGKSKGAAKRVGAVLDSSSESEGHGAQASAHKRLKTTQKAQQKTAATAKASKPSKLQQKGIKAFWTKSNPPAPQLKSEPAAPHSSAELAAAAQRQAPTGSQPETRSPPSAQPVPDATKGLAAVEGEIPVMMPAKLATNKVVMELQCGSDMEAVDLSGDAGVVGRWLVQGDEQHPELSMDLKGVILSATMVPSASTLCVVNLTATEAKVELLTSEFMQLRPDPTQGGLGADSAQDDYFMYDDDDNYQYEGGTQARGKDTEEGEDPATKGKKQKAGAAGKKPAKKPAGKAARKKPAKAAGAAKGKKKK